MPDASDNRGSSPRLITQAEAANRLGVSIRTMSKLRAEGELAYIPGRPVKIPETEVTDYIRRKLVRAKADLDHKAAKVAETKGKTLKRTAYELAVELHLQKKAADKKALERLVRKTPRA
jgi:excisionase family DNA binding protein